MTTELSLHQRIVARTRQAKADADEIVAAVDGEVDRVAGPLSVVYAEALDEIGGWGLDAKDPTDLDTIRAMFDRAGVEYRMVEEMESDPPSPAVTGIVTADSHGRDAANCGYSGFYATFDFDAAGNLLSVGAWE